MGFYEDLLEEQVEAAAQKGAYLIRPHDVITLTGADRVRFLNGQVTCEIKGLEPLAMAYGYFTTAKGRIESDLVVQVDIDELRIVLPSGMGGKILERLRKYLITDRVELSLRETQGFYVFGQAGMRLLDPLGIALPEEPWRWVPFELQYQLQTLMRLPDLGLGRDLPCLVLIAEDAERNAETLAQTGLMQLDEEAYQQLRIEAGWPQAGKDYGEDAFPQEVGIEVAVSYTKGCYLGQEVVARIHYRGGVQRHLRGLLVELEYEPRHNEMPLPLQLDGQEVGKLTSLATLPRGDKRLALGIIHQKAAPGSQLELLDGDGDVCGVGEVVALPFPAPAAPPEPEPEPMPDLPDDAPVN